MNHYNEPEEVWKDIPGYEGLYQASTLGRIKSLHYGKQRILKESFYGRNRAYLSVSICVNRILKSFPVHQLIAMTFLKHIPNGSKLVIDHLDSNPINNRLDNLRIVTTRENSSKEKTIKSGLPVGVANSKNKNINKFRANITINNKKVGLGNFNTVEEASAAYQSALNKINNNEL